MRRPLRWVHFRRRFQFTGWVRFTRRLPDPQKRDYFGVRANPAHLVDMVVHDQDSLRSSGFLENMRRVASRGGHVRLAIPNQDCLIDASRTKTAIEHLCETHPEVASRIETIDFKGGRRWGTHSARVRSRSYTDFATPGEIHRITRFAWTGFRLDLCGESVLQATEDGRPRGEFSPETRVETEYERLLRAAPVGIAVTKLDGRLLYANDEFYEMLGYDPRFEEERERLDRRNIKTLYADPNERLRLIQVLQEHGAVEDFRVKGKDRFGDRLLVSMNCCSFSFRGRPCLETTLRDITDVVIAERIANINERDRERRDRERDDFLDRVSHDLKGPANRIEGLLNLIDEEGNTEPYRKALCSNAHLIKRLTRKLLEFSRIHAGRVTVRPAKVTRQEIVELLDEIRSAYEGVLDENSIKLDVHVSKSFPEIQTDEDKLHAVLINLLDNALKFVERDTGEVKVSAEASDAGTVIFSVWDNGCGIAPEMLKKILGKYQQAERTSDKQGFGIGLFIASTYATKLGGTLNLDSQVGGPTIVRLRIPVRFDSHGVHFERSSS